MEDTGPLVAVRRMCHGRLEARAWEEDLAALARAGFSFAIAKRVIDGTVEDAPSRP
jgi:hypothetical protein